MRDFDRSKKMKEPLRTVAERARRSAVWLHEDVLHLAAPLPAWTRRGG